MWTGFVNSNGNWDGAVDNSPLPLNQWTHVVASWDGSRLGIHRNTGDVASNSGIVGPGSNTGGACIGVYPDGTSWRMNGFFLSDVRIYPYRLYDGDVQALYNSYFTPVAKTWVPGREPQALAAHFPLFRANVRDASGNAIFGPGSAYADAGAGVGPRVGMESTYFNGGAYLLLRGYPAMALASSYTLAAWVYPTAAASGRAIISKRYSGGTIPFVLGYGNEFGTLANAPWVGRYSGGWAGCGDVTALPLNQWSHVAGTYDGSIFRIYRNGVLTNFSGAIGAASANDDQVVIGHRWDTFATAGFPGYISDARIYNGALPDADIKAIYDRASGVARNWMPLGRVT
jgi:hypothetical protein